MLLLELEIVSDAGVLRGSWCIRAEEVVLPGGACNSLPVSYSFVKCNIELGHLVLQLNILLSKCLYLVKVGVMLTSRSVQLTERVI